MCVYIYLCIFEGARASAASPQFNKKTSGHQGAVLGFRPDRGRKRLLGAFMIGSWSFLGVDLGGLGGVFGLLGGSRVTWGSSWAVMGPSWATVGVVLRPSWGFLGPSWNPLGPFLRLLEGLLGPS